jgi:hypothetical protein
MFMILKTRGFYVFIASLCVMLTPLTSEAKEAATDFCWKDSYGRGAGKPLSRCKSNQDKIGALCYSKCPSNMKRKGFDCHSKCPKGWRDDGLFCANPVKRYERKPYTSNKKCKKKSRGGKCDKIGLLYYKQCKSDQYKKSGLSCIPKSDCKGLKLKSAGKIFGSCAKKVSIGKPVPLKCSSSQQKQGALCYKKCKKGYTAVGPVCWNAAPKGWKNCGLGAAKDKEKCTEVSVKQGVSVLNAAVKMYTLGSSSGQFEDLKKHFATAVAGAAFNASDPATKYALNEIAKIKKKKKVTDADRARVILAIISAIDPTGLVGVASAFTYPTCDKIRHLYR